MIDIQIFVTYCHEPGQAFITQANAEQWVSEQELHDMWSIKEICLKGDSNEV